MDKDILEIYQACKEGYHRVDDFRAKWLGFLPLGCITVLGTLFYQTEPGKQIHLNMYHLAIRLFGITVNLGLLKHKMNGIKKCTNFIKLDAWIEEQVKSNLQGIRGDKGYFSGLLHKGTKFFTEPVASVFVYGSVIALWAFVICLNLCKTLQFIIPSIVFLIVGLGVVAYWLYIFNQNDTKSDY